VIEPAHLLTHDRQGAARPDRAPPRSRQDHPCCSTSRSPSQPSPITPEINLILLLIDEPALRGHRVSPAIASTGHGRDRVEPSMANGLHSCLEISELSFDGKRSPSRGQGKSSCCSQSGPVGPSVQQTAGTHGRTMSAHGFASRCEIPKSLFRLALGLRKAAD